MIHEDEEDEDLNEDEIELLLQCDGSEHQPLSPARKFLLNQQRSLTRVRQRLETDIKRALFHSC